VDVAVVGVVVGVAVVGVTAGVGVVAVGVVAVGVGATAVAAGVAVGNGLGDAMAVWTGSQDPLAPCAATGAAGRATAAVALPAVSAKRPQETAASRTPAVDRATTVRHVRVKRIWNALASAYQDRCETNLSV
jgi:hypothetical protein